MPSPWRLARNPAHVSGSMIRPRSVLPRRYAMSAKPLGEQRIAQMNIDVAAFQRAGKIQEGVALADEAFFAALEELPSGHFLRAQSARNRAIMQFMSGNN